MQREIAVLVAPERQGVDIVDGECAAEDGGIAPKMLLEQIEPSPMHGHRWRVGQRNTLRRHHLEVRHVEQPSHDALSQRRERLAPWHGSR